MTADTVQIFVDGACRNNGQFNPQGGCGVFWGEFHPMNTYEALIGDKQTNNCAELSAAIIALAQCKALNVQSAEIHTDSKYVKDGITKWIKSWKTNDWKLKNNSAVLNKDLWVILDTLQNERSVIWKWVEGHTNNKGNLEADALAKSGISADMNFWQIKARSICRDKELTYVKGLFGDSTELSERKEPIDHCIKCKAEVSVSGIQCMDCREWFHYVCTQLPPYQLYMYECSNRKYTCMGCARVPEEFLKENEFYSYADNIKSTSSTGIQTGVASSCEVETQTTDVCHKENETVFTSIMDKTVTELQSKFVEALDKITSFQNDNQQRVAEISKLHNENDVLRRKLETSISQTPPQKCNCNNIKRELENVCIDKDNWRRRYADLSLQKEVELAQSEASAKILNQQLECSRGQIRIVSTELENLERRIASKNVEITDMDTTIQDQRKHIHNLEEEILSWKLHASRSDDSLLKIENLENKDQENNKDTEERDERSKTETITTNRSVPHDISNTGLNTTYFYPDHSERNPHTKSVVVDNQHTSTPQRPQKKDKLVTKRYERRIDNSKKNVLMLGTSNTKFVSAKYISQSTSNVYIRKVLKYTMSQAKEFVKAEDIKDYDSVLLHLFGNDLKVKSVEQCMEEMADLVKLIKEKHSKVKVIISLALLRSDDVFNHKADRLNLFMKEKYIDDELVHFCDNSNLSFRGKPAYGTLTRDGIHLTKAAVHELTSNFQQTLRETLKLRNHRQHGRGNRMPWWHVPYGS